MTTFRNTVCSIIIGGQVQISAYDDGTECSETSAYKIQTPGNYPEGSIQENYFIFIVYFIANK
jgi:hypothetical protein